MMRYIFTFIFMISFFFSCKNFEVAEKEVVVNKNTVRNMSDNQYISVVVNLADTLSHFAKTEVLKDIAPGELRFLSQENKSFVIRGLASATFSTYNETYKNKLLTQAGVIFGTGVITIIGSISFFLFRNFRRGQHEKKILVAEMKDVQRHYNSNLKWLNEINFDAGIPLDFYIERLATWDDLILKSSETYRTIPRKYTSELAHVRLLIRNSNIESKGLLQYLKSDDYNHETAKEYLAFIKSKTVYLDKWLGFSIQIFDSSSWLWYKKKRNAELARKSIKTLKENTPLNVIMHNKEKMLQSDKLTILTRESSELALSNFINLPPSTESLKEPGVNVLHMNSRTNHYSQNESAKAFIETLQVNKNVRTFKNDSTVLKFAVEEAMSRNVSGLFLEFGFCSGTTLNFISAIAYDRKVVGFDSLKGLPVNWRNGFDVNVFSYKNENKFPFVPLPNSHLVIGAIEETLPVFIEAYLKSDTLSFIHIDTDTFDAATIILNSLENHIKPEKTIVIIDEGYNYSDSSRPEGHDEWKKHEFLAVQNFANANKYEVEFLAFNENHQQLVLTFRS